MVSNSDAFKIITIDPGYDRVGWAVGEVVGTKVKPLDFGCIETTRSLSLFKRYQEIIGALTELLDRYQPTEAAIETLFFSKNKSTAMDVSEARGIILGCFLQRGMKCYEYSPVSIKLAVTGHGQADKRAVEKMVQLQLPVQAMMSQKGKVLDDTMDALALLITHSVSRASYSFSKS